jgi:membrane-associated phospholipid phosphatase
MGLAALVAVWLLLRQSKATPLEVMRELAVLIPAYLLYTTVRGSVEGREAEAFARAADVISLERTLGIFWEAELQSVIVHNGWLVSIANSAYTWFHWPVIITVGIWLFWLHRDKYPMYRNAFLISGIIALIVYATMPTAPPRFMNAWGFVDTIAAQSGTNEMFQPPAFVNQYAAMPSLHFGWNLLAGIAIYRHAPTWPLKALGIILPAGMFLSIVFTANHFIIDGLAGGMVALLALSLAMLLRRFIRRDDDSPTVQRVPALRMLA